ncbi:hypothetical protein GCM10011609_64320 [Lentzea pudingi]|uniref:Uncharacterized protein n=1 Tax=Lentzea pudingi TaxID=1789439 RepID=A0ABQ2IK59_9PSEU|nr:hypothetical protein GCM10011609_64320 [Lentzea pudingi]
MDHLHPKHPAELNGELDHEQQQRTIEPHQLAPEHATATKDHHPTPSGTKPGATPTPADRNDDTTAVLVRLAMQPAEPTTPANLQEHGQLAPQAGSRRGPPRFWLPRDPT